jgi:hypothetical protein
MQTRPSRSRQRGHRLGSAVAVLLAAAGAVVAPGTSAQAAAAAPDLVIVSGAQSLTPAQVRGHDITTTAVGKAALAKERVSAGGLNVDRRPVRVFQFGDQQWVVPATTAMTVVRGRNKAGKEVFAVAPRAGAAAVIGRAGFVSPPTSAFKYNNDSSFATTVGTWTRTVWWTLVFANNWRACSTCTAYDHWRIYGRMQAAALTGSTSSEGFKRAWLEFDRTSSPSAIEFEPNKPVESYGGNGTQTTTIGFSSGATVTLGAPPVTASATADNSYTGSITKNTENWHPVVRSEAGSGGVQWCRYESAEFTGTKYITTRVNVRHSSTAGGPSWNILTGQQDFTSSCPSQI